MPHHTWTDPVLVTATRFTDDAAHPNLTENRHLGWMIVTNRRKDHLYCTPGAAETATFFRSSAKPFQAFPLVQRGHFQELSPEALAITCASHTGSAYHTNLARQILEKAGLPESLLQCGPQMPIDPAEQERLMQSGAAPAAIHNNCSGKHAGMLLCCQRAGWDPARYLEMNHPLQQAIVDTIRTFGEVSEVPLAIDGCGAPVFYLPLSSMALLYAHLSASPEFEPMRNAMTQHPAAIGGPGRVDTVIMQASQGQLVAKVGADGVLCVGHLQRGEGLALKIADGATDIRNLALVEILVRIGWLDAQAAQDPRLQPYRDRRRLNTQNRVVGEIEVHFQP